MKKTLLTVLILVLIVLGLSIKLFYFSEVEVKERTNAEIFHDTGVTLYEEGLLQEHYDSCRAVAQETLDKELSTDCGSKARLLGVFSESYYPIELHYVYPVHEETYVTQSAREHYDNNGILATDVGTDSRPLPMYAPDIRNKAVEYVVSYEDNYMEHYGRALVLTSGMERFVIGHIDGIVEGSVTTGELIGKTTMEGLSSGYHAHIEYWTGIPAGSETIWNQTEYKVDPNYNPHRAILESRSPTGERQGTNEHNVFFTSYNPKCNQTKGGIEGEDGGCYATVEAPCAVGSLKGNTSGFCGLPYATAYNLRDLYREGKNPIALSKEMRERFPKGTTVLVTPKNHDQPPFEAIVADALNDKYDGLFRGDLYKEKRENNQGFYADITLINY